jgi:hypothetical protein
MQLIAACPKENHQTGAQHFRRTAHRRRQIPTLLQVVVDEILEGHLVHRGAAALVVAGGKNSIAQKISVKVMPPIEHHPHSSDHDRLKIWLWSTCGLYDRKAGRLVKSSTELNR